MEKLICSYFFYWATSNIYLFRSSSNLSVNLTIFAYRSCTFSVRFIPSYFIIICCYNILYILYFFKWDFPIAYWWCRGAQLTFVYSTAKFQLSKISNLIHYCLKHLFEDGKYIYTKASIFCRTLSVFGDMIFFLGLISSVFNFSGDSPFILAQLRPLFLFPRIEICEVLFFYKIFMARNWDLNMCLVLYLKSDFSYFISTKNYDHRKLFYHSKNHLLFLFEVTIMYT